MTKHDGGPAFPNDCHPSNDPDGKFGYRGMNLRQYYAGLVMQGLAQTELYFGTTSQPSDPWKWVAEEAVKAADTLIKELEKK